MTRVRTAARPFTVFFVLLGLLGLGLANAPSASAHDRLLRSTPADGATVSAPDTVGLTFNAEIVPAGSRIQVTGPDGQQVTSGEVSIDGVSATQAVDISAPGRYAVTWRVTSSDGHPISGNFAFTVEGGGAQGLTDTTSAPPTSGSGTDTGTATEAPTNETAESQPGFQASSSTPPATPSEQVDTNATNNQPWLIVGLGVLALLVILGGGWYARGRVRDDA